MSLSRNYNLLFELICAGHEVLAFVDYRWHGDGPETKPLRDPCSVQRDGEWQISIAARGICYGGLYPFQREESGRTEREQFIVVCERSNLEFAAADAGVANVPEIGDKMTILGWTNQQIGVALARYAARQHSRDMAHPSMVKAVADLQAWWGERFLSPPPASEQCPGLPHDFVASKG